MGRHIGMGRRNCKKHFFLPEKLSLATERHSAYFGGDANMNGTVSQKSFQAGKTAFCDFNSNSGIQFLNLGMISDSILKPKFEVTPTHIFPRLLKAVIF